MFVITITSILLLLRNNYQLLINDLKSFGWMCAIAHNYPFLSGLWFQNKNTPQIVINFYYGNIEGTFNWSKSAPFSGVDNLVKLPNWRNAPPNTIVWYCESNTNVGFTEAVTWAISKNMIPTASTPGEKVKNALNFITSYVLPFAMLGAMII